MSTIQEENYLVKSISRNTDYQSSYMRIKPIFDERERLFLASIGADISASNSRTHSMQLLRPSYQTPEMQEAAKFKVRLAEQKQLFLNAVKPSSQDTVSSLINKFDLLVLEREQLKYTNVITEANALRFEAIAEELDKVIYRIAETLVFANGGK